MSTHTNPETQPRIEHIKAVCQRVGLSRTTIFELTRARKFPQPISLSPSGKRKGFLAHEVTEWLNERAAARA